MTLSSVLQSPQAIQANIEIVRAFVRLREMLATHADLGKLATLEKNYDAQFRMVLDVIRELMTPTKPRRKIGFRTE